MAENKRKRQPQKNQLEMKPKKSTKRVKTKRLSDEIKGIMCIALGIVVFIAFYFADQGMMGKIIKEYIFLGLFGIPAYTYFVFIIWQGVNLFLNRKREKKRSKSWAFIVLMISASVLTSLMALGIGVKTTWESTGSFWNDLLTNLKVFHQNGINMNGGGVLGDAIVALLATFMGKAIMYVLVIAVLIIMFIVITGISLEKSARKIAAETKIKKEEIEKAVVDVIPDEEEIRLRHSKKRKPEEPHDNPANKDYFDNYFADNGMDDVPHTTEGVGKKFTLDEIDIKTPKTAEKKPVFEPEEEIIDISRGKGTLTNFPDENGVIHSDDEEFEPPSEAQLKDKLAPEVQEMLDRGVPLDEAVLAAKKMLHEEVENAKNEIKNLAEQSLEATKIIKYKLPPLSLLDKGGASKGDTRKDIEDKANKLLDKLASFKVEASIINITQGPTVTRFELQPGFGVKVSKITNLADDIALSLAAPAVRIEAPIPGKAAIGIEIPNVNPNAVPIREVLESDKFRNFPSKTAFALGKDLSGECIVADIAQFPHVLIAGSTGSGKSVCINSLITSILYKAKPNEVKLIMIDPKQVELVGYNGIPHLLIPVVTDPRHAAGALNWAVAEMKNRYGLMKDNKVRNLQGYNELMEREGREGDKLPEIVVIIDELADLMMAAKGEVEDAINSLAALARAAGMYLVIATQRPSVNVVTGVIKANVPTRIAFAVSSHIDSSIILDTAGAEKLLGKGDMLYLPRGAAKPKRIQGNFVSDEEIEKLINYVKEQYTAEYDEDIIEQIKNAQTKEPDNDGDDARLGEDRDELFVKAVEMVIDSGQASVAMFQRHFKMGYQRAARLIDTMEELHIIGPYEGTKPRQVLMTRDQFNEMLMNSGE